MIGDRIKLARKKAGLSLRGLADEMEGKVSAQAIGKYERNEAMPRSSVLIALSKALGVSITYLMDSRGIELGKIEFRTKSNTSAKDRARVETEVLEWVERYLQIEEILGLNNAAWSSPVAKPKKIKSLQDAEDLANTVREEWGLGYNPIPNMTQLLEKHGLKVLVTPLPDRVSGLTCLVCKDGDDITLPVIIVNRKFSLERRRLTLAHELAHRIIDPYSNEEKIIEKAATRFAGAFLMPKKHLEEEVGRRRNYLGYEEIIDLKRLYRVSAAALLVRLRDIDVLSDSSLTYAFQTIARTWRTNEPKPLEKEGHEGKREQPNRFERLCYRALAEGLISISKASELLRQPIDKVEFGLKGPSEANANHR